MHCWRIVGLLLVALSLLQASQSQADVCAGYGSQRVMALADETVTVTNSATVLTPAKYEQGSRVAAMAQITVEDAALRFTVTGTTPSSGALASTGAVFMLCNYRDIQRFQAIRTTSANATLKVVYFIKTP